MLTRVLKSLLLSMSGLASALLFFLSFCLYLAGTVHSIRTLVIENPLEGETTEGFVQVGIGLLTLLVGYGLAELAIRLLSPLDRTAGEVVGSWSVLVGPVSDSLCGRYCSQHCNMSPIS